MRSDVAIGTGTGLGDQQSVSRRMGESAADASRAEGEADGRRLAWSRAMERIQLDQWFHGYEPASSTAPSSDSRRSAPTSRLSIDFELRMSSKPSETDVTGSDSPTSFASAHAQSDSRGTAALHSNEHSAERDGSRSKAMRSGDTSPANEQRKGRGSSADDDARPASAADSGVPRPQAALVSYDPGEAADGACAAVVDAVRLAVDTVAAQMGAGRPDEKTLESLTRQASDVAQLGAVVLAAAPHRAAVDRTAIDPLHVQKSRNSTVHGVDESADAEFLRATALAQAQTTRVHLQWREGAVFVWLGMDGSAHHIEMQLGLLLPELERALAARGMRLGRIVCNGQLVTANAERPSPESLFLSSSYLRKASL